MSNGIPLELIFQVFSLGGTNLSTKRLSSSRYFSDLWNKIGFENRKLESIFKFISGNIKFS